MNPHKICFITCVNDDVMYEECLRYIHALEVPDHMELETLRIANATSMTAGYNLAMRSSDAKYKVYLHQDVFIVNRRFIHELVSLFSRRKELGLVGAVGAGMIPVNGIWWDAEHKWGQVYESHTGTMANLAFQDVAEDYQPVQALDGFLMATQYDLNWREDRFDGWHFYDLSQCMEFKLAGYEVGVAKQSKPWCIHDCGIVNVSNGFEEYRRRFLSTYGEKLFPKVSILIPTYNRPEYFEEALTSALAQDYPNIEIIVGDDSTNDETEKLIENYLRFYPQIKYIRNERNLGQFENDLMLMRVAAGEYINLLMDDDLIHPHKISRMMGYLLSHPDITLATSKRQVINEAGQPLPDLYSTKALFDTDTIVSGLSMAEYILELVSNRIGEPSTVLFKKSALKEPFGVFCGRRYGCNVDMAAWINLLTEGRMLYLAEPLSSFRIHHQQQQQSQKFLLLGACDFMHQILNAKSKGLYRNDEDSYYRTLTNCIAYVEKIELLLTDLTSYMQEYSEFLELKEQLANQHNQSVRNLPLVSILIPAYNRPHYLQLALQSALAQTYPNIEIIVSDDSTNDEVEQMIQPFLRKHDRIRYVRNETPLKNLNLQQCLDMAAGEYVHFLMDDDLFYPQKIEKMIRYLIRDNTITLVTNARDTIDENGRIVTTDDTPPLFDSNTVIDGRIVGEHCLLHLVNRIGEPSHVLFRKQDIEQYGMFNGTSFRFINDFATWMTLLSKGKLAYIAEPLSSYRIHSGQNQNNIELRLWNVYQWYSMLTNARSVGYLQSESEFKLALLRHLVMSVSIMGEAMNANRPELLRDQQVRETLHSVIDLITY